MYKAIIFDFDGVLMDTTPLHYTAWKRVFEEYGKTFTEEDYREKANGIPRDTTIDWVMGEETPTEIKEAISEKKPQYFLELLETHPEKATFLPGVENLLEQCKAHNVYAVVASSSKNVEAILKKAGKDHWFNAIFSGHDFTKPKPDPEIFLNAAKKVGVDPEHCIVIEDARAGMLAAKNGGFTVIGLTRTGEDMTGADMAVESIASFPQLFSTYFSSL